jgi:hypothetical protein
VIAAHSVLDRHFNELNLQCIYKSFAADLERMQYL